MRSLLGGLLLALALPASSLAQAPEPASAERTGSEPAARAGERPPPLAIWSIVLVEGAVPEEISQAASAALRAHLEPLAGGRPVRALEDESAREAFAACEDDDCRGGRLAELPAQAGVVLRLSRARPRGEIDATLTILDPVSGAPRAAPIEASLPADPEALPESLAALTATLGDAMPSPPPRPATILVAVNVDGAEVSIGGASIGASPVAPHEVEAGSYEVVVSAPGHLNFRRSIQARAGETARVDVTLTRLGAVTADTSDGSRGGGGNVFDEDWFWPTVIGGAVVIIGGAILIGILASAEPPPPQGIPLPPIGGM